MSLVTLVTAGFPIRLLGETVFAPFPPWYSRQTYLRREQAEMCLRGSEKRLHQSQNPMIPCLPMGNATTPLKAIAIFQVPDIVADQCLSVAVLRIPVQLSLSLFHGYERIGSYGFIYPLVERYQTCLFQYAQHIDGRLGRQGDDAFTMPRIV